MREPLKHKRLLEIAFDISITRLTARYKTCHLIQIANNSLRIAVPQKNFAIRRLDMHHFVSPNVGARAANAANAVARANAQGSIE
jgi:hypothetical protein